MSEPFVVSGQTYRAGRLDAIKQLHVVRRLSPLIGALQGTDVAAVMAPAETAEERARQMDAMMDLLVPISNAVAAMSDKDTEYVLGACLGVVQREQPGGLGWAPVWSQAAMRPMYEDMTLPAMIQVVGRVLMANLGDFTAALPRPPSGVAPNLR